ncbi:MAG: hypothetical protein EOO27_29275 [Comamonadaceae bacterium]|nr:MAG: hypothetical protein EOO27_29275 [Comamonadaceae bacterium]
MFSTAPRTLIVYGCLLVYVLAANAIGDFVPWWLVTLAGMLLFAFLVYLGTVWADRDLLRRGQEHDPSSHG